MTEYENGWRGLSVKRTALAKIATNSLGLSYDQPTARASSWMAKAPGRIDAGPDNHGLSAHDQRLLCYRQDRREFLRGCAAPTGDLQPYRTTRARWPTGTALFSRWISIGVARRKSIRAWSKARIFIFQPCICANVRVRVTGAGVAGLVRWTPKIGQDGLLT